MRSLQELKLLQALPLDIKFAMTNRRIRDWVSEFGIDGVYVSLRRKGDYKYAIIGGKEYEVTQKVFWKLYKMKARGKAREVYREEGETW